MRLSKAALADCVIDLLRAQGESADEPIGEEFAAERLAPVLTMRGDKPPQTVKQRRAKALQKNAARRIFDEAARIAGVE